MKGWRTVGASIAAITGFLVGFTALLSLLLGDNPALFGDDPQAEALAQNLALPGAALLRLLVIMLALSIVIGIANLLLLHARRMAGGRLMSGILLASFAAAIGWRILLPGEVSLLEAIQLPIESALAALLCLTLVAGGARILTKRSDIWGLLLVLVVVVVLLGSLPFPELAPIAAFSDWLMRIPAQAGARAILLGIALGSVVVGARALLGQDRSLRG
ncbi:MAG: hypothetical protein OXG92_10850 [Chloroflexi bacterium]|nr:hypothetical protein [Chloroflexota bacterium]MCY3583670.1 hypothetical protein [Chloroflexota bacterium]MCY3716950.1 hypothetical protein [Chloroflexota bacterium]MDE2650134.1 hypothetical protein [Chloroflexota bacterium]MXX49578.1 hypothetical protein [Chloroflexota bacterium]